jgi:sialic acid synthase SpsE
MKIIAELCQNHNGNIDQLLSMVDLAIENGADIVKIQAIYSNELNYRGEFENSKPDKFGLYRPYSVELERLKKLDLDEIQEKKFVEYCKIKKITPMITVFTLGGIQRALNAGFKDFKIASYDSTNLKLIQEVISIANNVYISTGATTELELEFLVSFLNQYKKKCNITLLHCKTEYPTKLDSVNLQRMLNLSNFGYKIGYSDHTQVADEFGNYLEHRNVAAFYAMSLGAEAIERHFTSLNPNDTKDGKISITKSDLYELSKFSKLSRLEQAMKLKNYKLDLNNLLGSGTFEPSVEEWLNRSYYKGRFHP